MKEQEEKEEIEKVINEIVSEVIVLKKHKEKIRKLATVCPECGKKLEDFVSWTGLVWHSCYCPDCNIIRSQYLTVPYLCEKCHSYCFIALPNGQEREENQCWCCKEIMAGMGFEKFKKHQKNGTLKQGYYFCKAIESVIDKITKENECSHIPDSNDFHRYKGEIFFVQCEKCGKREYVFQPDEQRISVAQ